MIELSRFGTALKRAETALQGEFPEKFLLVLYDHVKKCSIEDWEACTNKIATGLKKVQDLMVGDFLEALREVQHDRALKASTWRLRSPGKWKPDWDRVVDKLCADPAVSEQTKSMLKKLASQKAQADRPPIVGGEKHRRKTS